MFKFNFVFLFGFLLVLQGFAQTIDSLTKSKSWEIGTDLLWLINKNSMPAYTIFAKRNFTKKNGQKAALRFRLGADMAFDKDFPDQFNRSYFLARFGYENQRQLYKNLSFIYGSELHFSYEYLETIWVLTNAQLTIPLEIPHQTWQTGLSNFIGFRYQIHKHIAISFETSFNIFYRRYLVNNVNGLFGVSVNDYQNYPATGSVPKVIGKLYPSTFIFYFTPISFFNLSFNF